MKHLLPILLLVTFFNGCYKPVIDNTPAPTYNTWPNYKTDTVNSLYIESARPITDTGKNYIAFFLLHKSTGNTFGAIEKFKGLYQHVEDTSVKHNSSLSFRGYWIEPIHISGNKSGRLQFNTYRLNGSQLLYANTPYDNYLYSVDGYGLSVTFKYGNTNDFLPDSIVIDRMNWLLKRTDSIPYRNY